MGTGKAVDRMRRATCSGVTEWTAERPSRRSLTALHLSLHKITEVLAHELGSPTAAVPEWSDTEWAVARAVAAIHGVSPLLAGALRWQGPAGWRQFLVEQKVHTAKRFLRIQELLQLIDGHARRAGLALVPLKGAALHASGIYLPGERPMADLDLLVPEAQCAAASQILAELGYRETPRTWKHQIFERPGVESPAALGEHADNAIQIELHCHIREILPLRAVDISAIVFPQRAEPGLNAYPSHAALLLHLLLHTAGVLTFRELRLLQLHDIARLSSHMTDEDWEDVLRNARSLWWAYPTLALVARYYDCVPGRVLAQAARDCPWVLRRAYRRQTVAAASLSHLWVSAFPGIAWAHSPLAMLQYVASRVLPSRETLERRKAWAIAQPLVSGGAWGQLSQGRRTLRWLFARQARRATLQPACAALRAGY
jgi:hypothetical protein